MNSEVLLDLENRIGEVIDLIADLRKEKEKLAAENQSLKQQLDKFKTEIEEYKKKAKDEYSDPARSGGDFNGLEIKKRLKKLAGKLAALEDSWN